MCFILVKKLSMKIVIVDIVLIRLKYCYCVCVLLLVWVFVSVIFYIVMYRIGVISIGWIIRNYRLFYWKVYGWCLIIWNFRLVLWLLVFYVSSGS